MCGIAGVVHFDDMPVDPRLLGRMVDQVRHRGPDEEGVLVEGPVGLGHARLSIVDLAAGQQPMTTADGQLSVTFNGELFNFVELRRDLASRGHRFRTQSDTEVILHAYREWGDACVEQFNGQWAFCLFDRPRRRLLLSRDRLGVRPLHYAVTPRKIAFASEVKAIFADPEVPRRLDLAGLDQVLTFWCPVAPRTVFEGIAELPPAHNLVVESGRVRTWRYWTLDYQIDPAPRAAEDWAEELLALLTDATRLRLRSDVPVAAYLSGGLDSSITAALVKEVSGAAPTTFSVTFEDAEYDESRYQREVSEHLGTRHHAVLCRKADIGRLLPEVVWHAERPIVRTAPAPLYLLSGLVRQSGYKVVVTGEGADEMLGGYDLFKEDKLRRYWARQPDSARRAAVLENLYPYLPHMQAQPPEYREAFFRARPEDLRNPLFSHLPRWDLTSRLKMFLAPDVRERLAERDVLDDVEAALPWQAYGWAPFCRAQHLETALLLPGYILSAQGDRMAMAHGVEGRYPFLDHRLAEMAARMPPRLKMRGLCEKYLLKRAAGHLVPRSVAERTKQPYRAPDAASLLPGGGARSAHDWVEDLLARESLEQGGLFDAGRVGHLVRKARAGRAIGVKDNMALVAVLTTQLLVERFIAGRQAGEAKRPARPRPLPLDGAGSPAHSQPGTEHQTI